MRVSRSIADESRRELLHFAIVGGGPTGIEYAAELHDLIHDDLSRIYPSLMPYVKITVYDIAPKILPMFDQTLASYAMNVFSRQNIEVKTGHSIQYVSRTPFPQAITSTLPHPTNSHVITQTDPAPRRDRRAQAQYQGERRRRGGRRGHRGVEHGVDAEPAR